MKLSNTMYPGKHMILARNSRYGSVDFPRGPMICMREDRLAVHHNCWDLLEKAVLHVKSRRGFTGTVQLDVLVGYLISQNDSEVAGLWSNLDVGGAETLRENFWMGNQTSEAWFLTNFMDCPGIVDALTFGTQHPPAGRNTRNSSRNVSYNDQSVLSGLPAEILLQIICLLPQQDALNLRVASRTVASLQLPQEFWKQRFLETPYLWEFHKDTSLMQKKIDWRHLYEEVVTNEPKAPELRGLRNRKRVWKTLVSVAKEAWECEMKERELDGSYASLIAEKHNVHYLWAADGSGRVEYYSTPQKATSYRSRRFWSTTNPI
ncbi:hypothetical protein BDD12DRAFT_278761 [Trichophaea hybrida]|nr:hypothetical protein BDD12DRAFT_278761 [Trichophaea hybrida]